MICPKCKNEVDDSSVFCPKCGAPLKEPSESKVKEKEPSNKKVIIGVIAAILVMCVIGGVCVYISYESKPSTKYNKAEAFLAEGNYEKAIEFYEKAGEYNDAVKKCETTQKALHFRDAMSMMESGDYTNALKELSKAEGYEDQAEKINECNYQLGLKAKDEEKYETAIEIFTSLEDYKDSADQITDIYLLIGDKAFENGEYEATAENYAKAGTDDDTKSKFVSAIDKLVEAGEYKTALDIYNTVEIPMTLTSKYILYAEGQDILSRGGDTFRAIEKFEKAGDILDAKDKVVELAYNRGKDFFEKKNYTSARGSFKKSPGYKDTDQYVDYCNLLVVLEDLDNGKFEQAHKDFENVKDDIEYEGVTKQTVEAELKAAEPFEALAGRWACTGGEARVTQSGSYYDYWWYHEFEEGEEDITIECKRKGDGKYTVELKGSIYTYTEYSSISSGVKSAMRGISFTEDMSSSLGSVKIDDYTTVKLTTSGITANYKETDRSKDVYFKYIYKTDITFGKKLSGK
ncbi:zinc-ribbon domain-containing protein [Butyrivibrio sp. WCD2001]|uniref:zinc-ribbon domain-containing protein n=1 Tax=Butyrivibrio sp. WCD2001 TaxID=1280681 RepID=UPI000414C80B|nr:zinc-ribbon domain-containing protein [Butyrivibrio sp. WCD2001]